MTDDELIAEHMRTVGAVRVPTGYCQDAIKVRAYQYNGGARVGTVSGKLHGPALNKHIRQAITREIKKFPRVYEGK